MLLTLAFLAASLALGLVISKKFFENNHLLYATPIGVMLATWTVFLTSLVLGLNQNSVLVSTLFIAAASVILFKHWKLEYATELLDKKTALVYFTALISFALITNAMFHYDSEDNLRGIRTDFGFRQAITSTLANGNFPPEHPLYAGHQLVYYYFTNLFTASLMLGGFSLQTATNFVSTLLNTTLVTLLFLLGRTLFPKNNKLPYLALLLILFNGTFAFLPYIQDNQITIDKIPSAIGKTEFYSAYRNSGYPFENLLVTQLLIPNIVHLPLTIFAILILQILTKTKNSKLVITLFLSLLPLFHLFIFILIFVFVLTYALLFDRKKEWFYSLGIVGILTLPQLLYFLQKTEAISTIKLRFGWMSLGQDPFSIFLFWLMNLGPYLLLGAIGFYYTKNEELKKFFIASLPPVILANIFIFTPYNWDNIKLFLLSFILLAFLAVVGLQKLWSLKNVGKPIAFALIVIMTLTGFLSFKTLIDHTNDVIYFKEDVLACKFIEENTPKNALFLTDGGSSCIYATGRKIYAGFDEWLINHGYEPTTQIEKNKKMLAGDCNLIKQNNINYVYIGGYAGNNGIANETFFEQYGEKIYENKFAKIYSVC